MAALLVALPLTAAADEADPAFEDAERALGTPAPTDTWELDDGVGVAEMPWDDFDAALSYAPRGGVHWGLEARVGAVPTESSITSARPSFEVFGFLDFRYAQRSPWRFRFGIAVGAEPFESTNLGAGTQITTSALSVRLRILPMSVDLGPNVGIRAGGDIGFQVIPSPGGGSVLVDAAGFAQIVGRTDDGQVEIGVYGGIRLTGTDRIARDRATYWEDSNAWRLVPDAIVGLSAGYLF